MRRAYIVYVDQDMIMRLIWQRGSTPGYWVYAEMKRAYCHESGATVDIPEDVKVEAVHYSFQRNSFGFVLTHPTFPEVPDGMYAPSLSLTAITIDSKRLADIAPDHIVGNHSKD